MMLNRRQVNVQKANLAAMCRISVKSLLDYACLYTHVDEDCEEFINFCAVFDQLVSHRLRPYPRKMWSPRASGSPRHFWEVLLENHQSSSGFLYQTCIPNIESIETLKSPKSKLRAFLRVALMEKRLSDYMNWLLDNGQLMRESYTEGALLASEEASVLCSGLIGLNAIDFNFCLKGKECELLGPLEISYGPFLKYNQSSASRSSDEIEMMRLSGMSPDNEEVRQELTEDNLNDLLRLQSLEKDFRAIKEQKDYLEELVRVRERQVVEMTHKCERMIEDQVRLSRDWDAERKTLDGCVLELQAEMNGLRHQNDMLHSHVNWLKEFKHRTEMRDVPMVDMANGSGVEMKSVDRLTLPPYMKAETCTIPSDRQSIMSSVSDQIRLREDSQSMVPLTGSLTDVNVAMLDGANKQNTGVSEAEETQDIKAELISRVVKETETTSTPQLTKSVFITKESGLHGVLQELSAPGIIEQLGDEGEKAAVLPITTDKMLPTTLTFDADLETAVLRDESSPLVVVRLEPSDMMVSSDGGLSTKSTNQDNVDALTDRERLATSSSDLDEISERANYANSDGSDTAWDMLSDSEHADQKGETTQ